ncbi:MAG: DegV family protein [Defluviitaleaceae bacterium]|nr:DegV family protein [Defluviitaleaceae bacterium]
MINLIVDSCCEIGDEYADGKSVTITRIPLNLQLGEEIYLDDENLDVNEYLTAMEACEGKIQTSAPAPGLFLEKFKAAGDNIIVITLSSKISATYQSAVMAKEMYIDECGKKFVHIFDSLTAAVGEGVLAMKVTDLAKKGASAADIIEPINHHIKNMRTMFILDRFDNMVKTGRMKPYVAKIASMLNVKPVCGDVNGEIQVLEKARGYSKAVEKMIKIIKDNTPDIESRFMAITHVAAYEKAVALKEEMIKNLGIKDVRIEECRGVTATYAARGGVIVAY